MTRCRLLGMSFVQLTLTAFLSFSYTSDLCAQLKTTVAEGSHVTSTTKASCEGLRAQFATLLCDREVELMPITATDLEIPQTYSTSLIWEVHLLKFAQELFDDPPKDIRKRASEVLRASIVACAKVKQCESQALEYFGVGEKSSLKLPDFSHAKRRRSARNESLVSALGEQLYESDAGALISRFVVKKNCAKLKAEAKQNQCDLTSAGR
jgi:hypothetical protein